MLNRKLYVVVIIRECNSNDAWLMTVFCWFQLQDLTWIFLSLTRQCLTLLSPQQRLSSFSRKSSLKRLTSLKTSAQPLVAEACNIPPDWGRTSIMPCLLKIPLPLNPSYSWVQSIVYSPEMMYLQTFSVYYGRSQQMLNCFCVVLGSSSIASNNPNIVLWFHILLFDSSLFWLPKHFTVLIMLSIMLTGIGNASILLPPVKCVMKHM